MHLSSLLPVILLTLATALPLHQSSPNALEVRDVSISGSETDASIFKRRLYKNVQDWYTCTMTSVATTADGTKCK